MSRQDAKKTEIGEGVAQVRINFVPDWHQRYLP